MRGLLTKDFNSEKRTIFMAITFWMAIYIFFYTVIRSGDKQSIDMFFTSIAVIPIIVMQDLLRNEKDTNSLSYLLSLPISKKLYVNEKLVFSIILMVLIILANIVSLAIITYFNDYYFDIKDLLDQTIFYILMGYSMMNIGLNFSVNMGDAAFVLSPLLVLVLGLIFMSILSFASFNNQSADILASGYKIVFGGLIYIGFNEWIRRSTIKKMKKKRY
ncbi:MAG: ABC-2 transporter permease [Anaerococcus sp.]